MSRLLTEISEKRIKAKIKTALDEAKSLHDKGGCENELRATKLVKQSGRILSKIQEEPEQERNSHK